MKKYIIKNSANETTLIQPKHFLINYKHQLHPSHNN